MVKAQAGFPRLMVDLQLRRPVSQTGVHLIFSEALYDSNNSWSQWLLLTNG